LWYVQDVGEPFFAPHPASPADLKQRLEAERSGAPFLIYRGEDGTQRIWPLPEAAAGRIALGREPSNAVCLDWDEEVSGIHAELERLGSGWALIDDGLSRNGTFVNGERITGRRRLRDGDVVRLGRTLIAFRWEQADSSRTTVTRPVGPEATLTNSQRRVLIALCRPSKAGSGFAVPATNKQIADEISLSIDGVKSHLTALFNKFGLDELPPNQKRATLAQIAMQSGVVSEQDL
jgi:hypothetical protein